MCGRGRSGVQIALVMKVADHGTESTFHLSPELTGAILNGPIGRLVARVLHGDVKNSVENLAALH